MAKHRPFIVAIVGGSGSGKSWLAGRLEKYFRGRAVRLSLDDFYKDRSHLSLARRARLNFDAPRAIDWPTFREVLRALKAGQRAWSPQYNFETHTRAPKARWLAPKEIVVADGLWLLHSPAMRRFFDLKIFLECCAATRLERRLARDLRRRGRDRASVLEQFRATVQPMHRRFVESQKRWTDVVLPEEVTESESRRLARTIIEQLAR